MKQATQAERIQSLMDEFYSAWQKEGNKGKSKWDVLGGFSQAHQIAVIFGNFNYQVENGGIEQWIYNGYFSDDADKLIDWLALGTKIDERCRKILDTVCKLDRYARETECDRYGSYEDPDDYENGFIGDMIDSNAFDNWYYEHCGDDDWWDTVVTIIDKAQGRDAAVLEDNAPFQPEERPSILAQLAAAKAEIAAVTNNNTPIKPKFRGPEK